MGDNSPKNKNKQKKQHDKEVADIHRVRQEKAQSDKQAGQNPKDSKKAS